MSHYAQNRRRGGGPPPYAEPPPTPATAIVSIEGQGTQFLVRFNGVATWVSGATYPDSSLTIDGFDVINATVQDVDAIAVTTAGGVYDPGLPWSLVSDPSWILDHLSQPAIGTTI